jgi:hypothetical protein
VLGIDGGRAGDHEHHDGGNDGAFHDPLLVRNRKPNRG